MFVAKAHANVLKGTFLTDCKCNCMIIGLIDKVMLPIVANKTLWQVMTFVTFSDNKLCFTNSRKIDVTKPCYFLASSTTPIYK